MRTNYYPASAFAFSFDIKSQALVYIWDFIRPTPTPTLTPLQCRSMPPSPKLSNVKIQLSNTKFLDLRKTFDTIDRKILLQKCKMYELRGPVYTILESYSKNRKQFVQSGQRKSQMTEVKYGVPQGSILGPLLFIVYINDSKTNSPCSNFIFYADDTAVYTKSNKANACREHQQILSQTENWLKMNLH